MSEPLETVGMISGAGLGGYLLKWFFTRSVEGADAEKLEMRANVKEILSRLQSMGDEQIRLRGDITGIVKDVAQAQAASRAAHDRIDALVAPAPRSRKR